MKTITIPESYIALVHETREAQAAYFEAALAAKKSNTPDGWKERTIRLKESKALEASLDQQTAHYLGEIRGTMTAEQALAAMRDQLDEDLDVARKEVSNG